MERHFACASRSFDGVRRAGLARNNLSHGIAWGMGQAPGGLQRVVIELQRSSHRGETAVLHRTSGLMMTDAMRPEGTGMAPTIGPMLTTALGGLSNVVLKNNLRETPGSAQALRRRYGGTTNERQN